MPFCLVEASHLLERYREIVMCQRMLGFDGQRPANAVFGFSKSPQRSVRFTQVVQEIRVRWLGSDRFFNPFNRNFGAAGLMRDQPQEVQCIRMIRLRFEHATVNCLRIRQPPRLVVVSGDRDGFWRGNTLLFKAHRFSTAWCALKTRGHVIYSTPNGIRGPKKKTPPKRGPYVIGVCVLKGGRRTAAFRRNILRSRQTTVFAGPSHLAVGLQCRLQHYGNGCAYRGRIAGDLDGPRVGH